jgi:hypothetical protein
MTTTEQQIAALWLLFSRELPIQTIIGTDPYQSVGFMFRILWGTVGGLNFLNSSKKSKSGVGLMGILVATAIVMAMTVALFELFLSNKKSEVTLDHKIRAEIVVNSIAVDILAKPHYVLKRLCAQAIPDCENASGYTMSSNPTEFSFYKMGLRLNFEGNPVEGGPLCITFQGACQEFLNGKVLSASLISQSHSQSDLPVRVTLRKARW